MLFVNIPSLAVGEVVGVANDDVVHASVADELVASSGEKESLLEDTAAAAAGDASSPSEQSLVPPLEAASTHS